MDPTILIAGHCTIDDIHLSDGRFLPATVGGAAAYATAGALMYGAGVTLVSLIGTDYPLQSFLEGLAPYGAIDASHVRTTAPRSIHNVAWYGPDGARRYDVESWDVMEMLTPTAQDLSEESCRRANALLTAGSLYKQRDSARWLRKRGCCIAVDTETHYFPTTELKRALREVVKEVMYFLPSIEHLQVLFDSTSRAVSSYVGQLTQLGCPWVIVKRGRYGSTVLDCENTHIWHVPPVHDVTVADATGAGDAFTGGFVAAVADGMSAVQGACWGTVSAAFELETIGAAIPHSFCRERGCVRYLEVLSGVRKEPW